MELAEELTYGDARNRIYRAAGGSKRCDHLLFIPDQGEHDRFLPFADIRIMEVRKDSTELLIEFSATVVIATGRNLRPVAYLVGAHMCSWLEAFNPQLHEKPEDKTEPFIAHIRYYTRSGRKEQQEPETKPMAEAH